MILLPLISKHCVLEVCKTHSRVKNEYSHRAENEQYIGEINGDSEHACVLRHQKTDHDDYQKTKMSKAYLVSRDMDPKAAHESHQKKRRDYVLLVAAARNETFALGD